MKYMEFYCPRWGSEYLVWEVFCRRAQDKGFDGIEVGLAQDAPEAALAEVWNAAAKAGLKIIVQHYDTCAADFSRHYDAYCSWLERMAPYPVVKINSQTGKDYFSFGQNKALIEAAAGCRLPVVHETHRSKFAFAAHVTRDYLEQIPGLRLTLDASHWVCVAGSYLDDQPLALQLALERTDHIHARVGYIGGAQVTDPRAPEWQYAREKHLGWWDQVVARKKRENEVLTITPEFGPFPYMVRHPFNGLPVADQWSLNVYMMNLLKSRYAPGAQAFSSTGAGALETIKMP
ncbi:sugar phosphate isomerase/epimerase [Paraflavisolibacter sp. H34]|uniref:sugar phosphate isomerase/epimerase family protein n=1 Tax=Huijunlia imazamoxiresistens TaxID=3127457 RepID=UPI00301926C3